MDTGRHYLTGFLQGEPQQRPAFVPLMRGMLARVGGVSLEHLTTDASLWAGSLQKTTELFDCDAVVAGFDDTLLAEGCGCSVAWEHDRPEMREPPSELCAAPETQGRLSCALEAARRVFQVCRNERACVAAMAGPVKLAGQLFGPERGVERIKEIKQHLVTITEAFCRLRPDMLILIEDDPLGEAGITLGHRRIYNTLRNIADYYAIPVAVYVQGYSAGDYERFLKLGVDIYIFGPGSNNTLPDLEELFDVAKKAHGVGIGLPLDDIDRARAIISRGCELFRSHGGCRFFLTSHGPVTRDIEMEALHRIVRDIQEVRL